MAPPLTTYVEVPAETFHREAAVLSFRGFRREGFGLVFAEFKETDPPDDVVRATLRYQPFDLDSPLNNTEIQHLMETYDPFTQYVLAVPLKHGGWLYGIVPQREIGITEGEVFLQAAKRRLPLEPGTVLRLTHAVGDVQGGFYVYTGQERAMMVLAHAEMEDEGDLVVGERRVELHVDYREWLEMTGIVIEGA